MVIMQYLGGSLVVKPRFLIINSEKTSMFIV